MPHPAYGDTIAAPSTKRVRFDEPLKFVPVLFVAFTILLLWFIYVFYHGLPLLQLDAPAEQVDGEMRRRGKIELGVFHFVTLMLIVCYIRAILVNPGEVPDDDPHWQYHPADGTSPREPTFLLEKKQTGERRHCKWCGKYKPDRCHHCRVCKTCVLKMDHHCPWIYNCVGFWNYKYFFLLLFYSAVDCHIIAWTMAETVTAVVADDAEFLTAFLVLFAEMLAASLGILLVLFFIFHIVLIVRAMTTIEVYEKTLPKKKGSDSRPYHHPIYDRGCCGNFSTVLGANPLLWLLPIGGPMGDGLYFAIEGLAFDSGAGVGQMPSQNTPLKPASGSAGWGPFSSGSGAGARFSHGYGGASSGSYGGGAFNGTMAPTY